MASKIARFCKSIKSTRSEKHRSGDSETRIFVWGLRMQALTMRSIWSESLWWDSFHSITNLARAMDILLYGVLHTSQLRLKPCSNWSMWRDSEIHGASAVWLWLFRCSWVELASSKALMLRRLRSPKDSFTIIPFSLTTSWQSQTTSNYKRAKEDSFRETLSRKQEPAESS